MSISNGNLVISRAAMCHRGSFIESWLCKILILMAMFAVASISNGQTSSYYQTGQDYNLGGGVVYRSDNKLYPLVFLYNAANNYHNTQLTYADGRPFTLSGEALMKNRTFVMPPGMGAKILSLAKAVFTSEQKTMLKGGLITVDMAMDSSTGRVLEIEFGFLAFAGERATLIPPSTFRALELALKNNDIYVYPSQLGRSLSRLGVTFDIKF